MAGLADKEIKAGHLGFILGPRLNAAGRIGDAADGLRLLLTDDEAEADRLARQLESLNTERQALDQRMLDEALEQVEREADPERDVGLVLASDGWHPGVVGIVASRVVERFGRPAFLIAFDGDIGKGSGRSISRFDLHEALVAVRRPAGAVRRPPDGGGADGAPRPARRLPGALRRGRPPAPSPLPTWRPSSGWTSILPLSEMTDDLERLCRHLEPCGMGNPGPVFGARGIRLGGLRRVGSGHLKATLTEPGSRLDAIGFQWWDRVPWLTALPPARDGTAVDIAFRLEQNEYQGQVSLQARICTLAPAAPRAAEHAA